MNDFDRKLRDEAARQFADFSEDRHAALVQSLAAAPARSEEAPLRTPRDVRLLVAAALVIVIGAVSVFTGIRNPSPGTAAGELGAPMRVAERSLTHVQSVASNLSNDPSAPIFEQADDIFSFFAKQLSMAESLAVSPPGKPRA